MKNLIGKFFLIGVVTAVCCSVCESQAQKNIARLEVSSPAFDDGQPIPAKYACEGANISPPLKWSVGPAGTKAFALTCDDPDAPRGDWVHWVIYNLPAGVTELPEKMDRPGTLGNGAKEGLTDFQRTGYGGPCPPPGKPHRYIFKVYALDSRVSLMPRATMKELLAAMNGHILAKGELMGTYERK